ncbi:hypothetical protein PORCRE_231 [Porphyromonas crevioricanis JCM 15906]|uniref:Uncharacterized protein n=2 Tax=Porphyromonas crevioricanis TaxID=393921 RepID=A0A2X4PNG9_9PORP|nr:hypothetical protein PORCRE_231 [Porphyromonas crevioricanis JCM 15906]GAD08247.1 hypothetical protein PORCAN_1883 [Porphyromonas crevioricanis JCM 13913]SJZ84076.1 hypothetical protein SAMN02745203_01021 [Porphyromonas crevioricanis]SQH73078.1 Uncharacterised protein [Porphyromonas crevioricanis]
MLMLHYKGSLRDLCNRSRANALNRKKTGEQNCPKESFLMYDTKDEKETRAMA